MPKKKPSAAAPASPLALAEPAASLASDLTTAKGRKKGQHSKRYEQRGEPSARDLSWYHSWSVKFVRQCEIARAANVKRETVCVAIKKVDAWLKSQMIDDILSHRVRQTETLEHVVSECLEKWVETKEVEFAEEARKILSDIRKMWGMDKPQKIDITTTEGEGLERVAGKPRSEAIKLEAERMLAAANAVEG